MTPPRFHLFETALGRCAVAWRNDLIIRILLPAASDESRHTTIMRIDAHAAAATPPARIAEITWKIAALCDGAPQDFGPAPLERSTIDPFAARVYARLEKVGFGRTTTYGAIAAELGDRSLARAVGAALGANPFPIVIPCHRVTGANGALGGFSAPGGAGTKRRLLEIEGAFTASTLPLFAR